MEPIINLPLPLAIDGLNISLASTTVLAIAPGQARDVNDQMDMAVGYPNLIGSIKPAPLFLNCPKPLYINSAVVGANGIDAGTLGASSSYNIFLIGDSRNFNPSAGLLSLYSNQYPLLPSGYDSYRMIGHVTTTAGSVFDGSTILNERYAKQYFLLPYVSELSGGNSTTFAAIDLSASSGISTTTNPFVTAYLNVIFTPSAVGDTVQFRPTGSSATAGLVTIVGQVAGIPQVECVAVMTGVSAGQPKVDYKVSVAGDSVSVLVEGWNVTLA